MMIVDPAAGSFGSAFRVFAGAADVLSTHRGYDLGAVDVARALGRRLGVTPFIATTTRLVVDLNRSPDNRNVFSAYTRGLSSERRAAALAAHYRPYRDAVESAVADTVRGGGTVLHVSAHSFTPVLRGEVRRCDVGFLYDPRRVAEVAFCREWQARLADAHGTWRVRMNYPYRGTSDGLVTALRRELPEARYIGMEIEINQERLVQGREKRSLLRALAESAPLRRWPSGAAT